MELTDIIESCTGLWSAEHEERVINVLKRGKTGQTLSREEYHILNSYTLVSIGGVHKVTKMNGKYMATKEGVLTIIALTHTECGHGGEKKTYKKISEKYGNIPRTIIQQYIKRCERCVEKRRRKETASGVVVRPLTAKDLNERGQVDLVDMQTMKDGGYRYILHYVEYLTKFHVIRPLKSKTACEVAHELLMIFLDFGAPHILQSDNGREFTAQIINELSSLWPELVLVNGRPRHPQSQGSVERSNGDMKAKLMAWMRDNNSSQWSYGIRFVQWAMNTSYHEAIKMAPYEALTGNKPRCGLQSKMPSEFLHRIGTGIEEELEELLTAEPPAEIPDTAEPPAEIPDTAEPPVQVFHDVEHAVDDNAEPHVQLPDNTEPPLKESDIIEFCEEEMHPAKRARIEAREGIIQQAKRMMSRSTRSLRAVKIGDNVAVPVSQFDRSKGDPPNIIGVVLSTDESGCVIGTKNGTINGKLARNQFEFVQYSGLKVEDVPPVHLSISEIVKAQSVCGGQGFRRCQCRSNCLTKCCSCLKAGLRCNSACHSYKSCQNID